MHEESSDPDYVHASSAAALVAVQKAIEKARLARAQKISERAAARSDITTFYGPIVFDAHGMNAARDLPIMQVQGQAGEGAVPGAVAQATLVGVQVGDTGAARHHMDVLQILVNGLLLGALYACIAVGFSLVWGVLNVINMLHGSLIILGGYLAFFAWQISASIRCCRSGRSRRSSSRWAGRCSTGSSTGWSRGLC